MQPNQTEDMDFDNRAEKFWDRAAASYDREEKRDEPTYLDIIEKTRTYLTTGDVVLDYGCGTGTVSNALAANVNRIHAIDISSKMIGIAKGKADRRNIQNIDYAYATLFDDRYETKSFDIILAFYVLHLVEDAPLVLQRMHELLKPGGILISATPCMGEKPGLSALLSIGSAIKIIPRIRSFKVPALVDLITNQNFELVEGTYLHTRSPQYFIVAKRKED